MAGALSLDRYSPGNSPLHRADSRVKVVATLAFILTTVSLPTGAWWAFVLMALLVWIGVALSRVGVGLILRRSLVAVPFVLVALPTVFTHQGDVLARFPFGVTATWQGLRFFVSVVVKSWVAVTAASLLTATTPFPSLMGALKSLKVPDTLLGVVAFHYRYLHVLADEAQRLLRAREARSAGVGRGVGGPLLWRARVAGWMVGSLFLRTYERSERVYMAMLARGYDGRLRMSQAPPLARGAIAQIALLLGLLLALALAAHLGRSGLWPSLPWR